MNVIVTLTVAVLGEKFDEYNHLYFGSVLPRCEFSVRPISYN